MDYRDGAEPVCGGRVSTPLAGTGGWSGGSAPGVRADVAGRVGPAGGV